MHDYERSGFLLAFLIAPALVFAVIPTGNLPGNCTSFRDVLSRTIVRHSASYFADNPRANGTVIDPNEVRPLTPAGLFKAFYGDRATPQNFKNAILRMYYSDPGRSGTSGKASDLIVLRGNIKTFALASSYDLARERFGLLLYRGVTDLAKNSSAWLNTRCLEGPLSISAENFLFSELEKIRNEIGEFRFGQFLDLGSGTTLAFVIDDTGSMSGEIEAAKRRAKLILDERQGSLDQAQDFVLVPFNDPTYGPVTATTNADVFRAAIDKMSAKGGGDSPELALRGMLLAVENSRVGSTIFVITDVDAKDVELQDILVAQAKQKNIKIIFLLTNRFRRSMCISTAISNTALYRRRCSTPSFKFGMDLYNYIARSTGGSVLIVSKSDIFQATQVIDVTVKQGVVHIAYHVLTDATRTFTIDVDSLLSEVFFQFTGGCSNITVTHRGRRLVLENGIKVGNLFEGKILVNASYGEWAVRFTAIGTCSLKVNARSTMGFLKTLAKRVVTKSRASVYERFEGQPLFNSDVLILLDAYGKTPFDKVRSVKFISRSTGAVLDSFELSESKVPDHFRIKPQRKPLEPFFLLVEGLEWRGYNFSRIIFEPIEFVNVEISCINIENMVIRPGITVNIPLSVRNHGVTDDKFEMGVSDTLQYVSATGVVPTPLTVAGNNGVTRAVISATPSNSSVVGTTNVITITAKSNTSSRLLYKTCRMVIDPPLRPRVESFAVDARINSRFAETKMTSVVLNDADEGRSADFYVLLPVEAFITNFSMTIDGVTYNGQIREKEKAARIFQAARERDITAGHVAARDKSTNVFQTSVNLAPRQRVTFVLTYQEVLFRKNDNYTYRVAMRMLQPVENFSIDVSICESKALKNVNVLGFDTDQTTLPGPVSVPGVSIQKQLTSASISYKPTSQQQSAISPFGLNGKFVVQYNLIREKSPSEMVISGKYFLHFVAPEVNVMPKRVIFTLDVSGSMFGLKLAQLRSAMNSILSQFQPTDSFAIIVFNSTVHKWSPLGTNSTLVPATPLNKVLANFFLLGIRPRGGTDIITAVQASLNLMNEAVNRSLPASPLGGRRESLSTADYIVLLTDGRSTQGIIDSTHIVSNISALNRQNFGIHTIGFGTLVDMDALSKIAAQNSGSSTQIFVDIDASTQISDFYETISKPMLHKVAVSYPRGKVARSGKSKFPSFFGGSEMLISGVLKKTGSGLGRRPGPGRKTAVSVTITGFTRKREKRLTHNVEPKTLSSCGATDQEVENFGERMHVFLQLKSLLRQIAATTNRTQEQQLKKLALNQSLRFNFVTPGITSMIVLKPDDVREIEEALAARRGVTTPPPTVSPTPPVGAGRVVASHVRPHLVDSPPRYSGSTAEGRTGLSVGPALIGPGLLDRLSGRLTGSSFYRPPPPRPRPTHRMEIAGDPHVFVDLNDDITVCFNWLGREGEIYNILHDQSSGLTVNAKLIDYRSSPGSSIMRVTFIGEIGIVMKAHNMTMLINPKEAVISYNDGDVLKLPLKKHLKTRRNGVVIETVLRSKLALFLTVTIDNATEFRILVHHGSVGTGSRSHLDFSVTKKEGLSKNLSGFLGQFQHRSAAAIKHIPESKKAWLMYRFMKIRVTKHAMYETYSNKTIDCWYVNSFADLTGLSQDAFKISSLLATPKMTTLPR